MTSANPWGHRGPATVEHTVHLDVPVRVAYDRWCQFETWPRFMRHVKRVDQVRPAVARWFVGLGPLRREFYAEVREQHPDSLVAWRSLGRRLRHEGEVSFRPVGEERSAVRLTMHLPCPSPLPERAVVALADPVVQAEMERYREYTESMGALVDTWRGTIHDGRVQHIEKHPPAHPGWVHG